MLKRLLSPGSSTTRGVVVDVRRDDGIPGTCRSARAASASASIVRAAAVS
jgi:hypothetical protein